MNSHSIKIRRNVFGGIFLFACAIMSKGFVDALFVADNANGALNLLKYFFLLGAAFAFSTFNSNKKKQFAREFKNLIFVYLVIALISIFAIVWSERFTFRTIKEFCFILSPIIFVYYAINALDKEEIMLMAKFSVIIYVISYFIEIADSFSVSMAINAIKNFSLLGGQASFAYDYYETSHFPDPMMALFCYFCYNNKNNRKWIWISYISVLLMNKRLIILFASIILVLSYLPYEHIYIAVDRKCEFRSGALCSENYSVVFNSYFGFAHIFFFKGKDNICGALVPEKFFKL